MLEEEKLFKDDLKNNKNNPLFVPSLIKTQTVGISAAFTAGNTDVRDFIQQIKNSYLHLVHHVKEMSRLETERDLC